MEIKVNKLNYKLNNFNYVSDIHIDFHVDENNTKSLIEYLTKDIQKSDTLIIAGDFANKNKYTFNFLREASQLWKHIFFVDGNHDSYEDKYIKPNNRVKLLAEEIKQYDNVVYLNRYTGIYEFANGVKMAGCNLWYDMDNPYNYSELLNMVDSDYISVGCIERNAKLDKEFYNDVIDKVDIFVSHTPVVNQFRNIFGNDLYYRNLEIYPNKVYLFGHMHEGYSFSIDHINTKFLVNPIGYRLYDKSRVQYYKVDK